MALHRTRTVWVASPSAVLSAAVAGGLGVIGWTSVRDLRDDLGDGDELRDRPPHGPGGLVLVADEHDALPTVPALVRTSASCVVAIATSEVGRSLRLAGGRDVHVVEAEQPLQAQLRDVDRALLGGADGLDGLDGLDDGERTPAHLAEAGRVATLTARESQVLALLMSGETAGEIAAQLVVSLPTVRSHIRAIMRKLGVSSQLAAVALACRESCGSGARLCQVHPEIANFDDVHPARMGQRGEWAPSAAPPEA